MTVPARGRGPEVLFLVTAAACWGIGTVVSKQAVAELPPLTLLAVQLATSVAFLALLARARGSAPTASPDRRLLSRLGLLNPGLAYALSLAGLTQISASLSVLLWASEPILILALAAVVLGERLGLAVIGSAVFAVLGLLLVVFDPAASGSVLGVGLTVAGVVACAIYSVAVRWSLPGATDSTLEVVRGQQLYAFGMSLVLLVGVALAGQAVVPASLTTLGAISAIGSGLLYYSFAYLCYLSALRHMPVSVAAASFFLIPIFGVTGGLLAGERLALIQWLGAIVVVVAVAVITTRPRREPSAPAFGSPTSQPSSAADSAQIAIVPSAASRR
jgi:drug/metabolite transporter (DMT)-like permease